MPDLENLLPLILLALYYIFRGGKKKRTPEKRKETPISEPAASRPAQAKQKKKTGSSLQDILEELIGETESDISKVFSSEKPKAKVKKEKPVKQSSRVEAQSLETLDPIIENLDDLKSKANRKDMIKAYEEEQLQAEMGHERTDFDLRNAIINQAILERPYE